MSSLQIQVNRLKNWKERLNRVRKCEKSVLHMYFEPDKNRWKQVGLKKFSFTVKWKTKHWVIRLSEGLDGAMAFTANG